ncbi:MAG: DoxX family protein [Planctomyces sp.]|nr:DoxX family protein [Planctomyces sp.]
MRRAKLISRFILAIFMIGAGTMHFVNPEFFLKIMPPYLPLHKELVLASGVCEVLLGALLLIPKYSRLAAWGIMGLLIAVFPANVYLFQNQDILPAPPIVHLMRLPLQGLFILWAYWHTKPTIKAAKST